MIPATAARFGRGRARNSHIDLLRGLSVLLVMFTHFSVCGPFSGTGLIPAGLSALISRNGYYGVSVFFVISGFVITSTSLARSGRPGAIRLREFYSYRISRIVPPLLVLVAFNLACRSAGASAFQLIPGIGVGRLLANVFTLRFNLLYLHGGSLLLPWAPLWSLAIEEVFYLVFPLLCLLAGSERRLGWVFALCIVAGPFYRRWLGQDSLYLYPGCFDLLALGCLTALAARQPGWSVWRPGTLAAARAAGLAGLAAIIAAANIHTDGVWVLGPSGMGLFAALFLLGSLEPHPNSPRIPRAWRLSVGFVAGGIGLMGYLSYELYLFHLPAFLLGARALRAAGSALGVYPRDAAFLVSAVILTALCAVLALAVNDPARRGLRNLLTASRNSR